MNGFHHFDFVHSYPHTHDTIPLAATQYTRRHTTTYHPYPTMNYWQVVHLDDHHPFHYLDVVFDTNRENEQPTTMEDQSIPPQTCVWQECRRAFCA
jgi:hypothetical protein